MTCACCSRCETIASAYADDVVALELALGQAQADCRAYRSLAYAAIDALFTMTAEYDEVYARYVRLLDELRGRAA